MVVPDRSGRCDHPDLRLATCSCRGVGHMSLPRHGGVVDEVAATLAGRAPGSRAPRGALRRRLKQALSPLPLPHPWRGAHWSSAHRPSQPHHRHHDTGAGTGRALTHRYGSITALVTTGGCRSTGRPVPPSLPRRVASRHRAGKRSTGKGAPCLAAVHRRSSSAPAVERRIPLPRPAVRGTDTGVEVAVAVDETTSSPGSPATAPPSARPPGAAVVRRARGRRASRRRNHRLRWAQRRHGSAGLRPGRRLAARSHDRGRRRRRPRSITAAEAQARLGELAASRAARAPKTVLPAQGRLTTCFCMRWGQMH